MTHCGFLTFVAFVVMLLQPIELNADSAYHPNSIRCSAYDMSMSQAVHACVRYKFFFWRYVCFFQCTDHGELKTDCARDREYPATVPCDDLYCLAKEEEERHENSVTEKVQEDDEMSTVTTWDFGEKSATEIMESVPEDGKQDGSKDDDPMEGKTDQHYTLEDITMKFY